MVEFFIFFLDFAFKNTIQGDQILCLSKECNNCIWNNWKEVYEYLLYAKFDKNSKRWDFHGEYGSLKKVYDNK